MKKDWICCFFLLLAFGGFVFAAFDDESFQAWSESIRKFSGMQNIQGKLTIQANLLEDKQSYELFYAMDFYSRDLRDFRIDFDSPRMLEGLTILYQYRERLLYVLNIEEKEYATQNFEAGQETQFNPTDLLMAFLDFLINIDSIELLEVYPEKTEDNTYFFKIILSPPEIIMLFQKEYPSINVYLNRDNQIEKIILINEQTQEKLAIEMLNIKINADNKMLDEYFKIPIEEYDFIKYLGVTD